MFHLRGHLVKQMILHERQPVEWWEPKNVIPLRHIPLPLRSQLRGKSMRVKAIIQVLFIAMLLPGCSRQDPIDRLMAKVEQESVGSYPFTPIALPDNAPPEQCISILTSRGE